ncbi:DUF6216 family protein [Stenotrophomonas sp. MYb57]|uniref:DUF6216 family protein n=1 Tax=Stenotrophomonas sp. MYb57 TaxID=1827305 RepID=UPI002D76D21F|nr:DUF6216 family protein [Stenotrophomonas sp. MYb57]
MMSWPWKRGMPINHCPGLRLGLVCLLSTAITMRRWQRKLKIAAAVPIVKSAAIALPQWNVSMKWESVYTMEPVWLTFIGLALAAGLICWLAGSLHPLKHRLLRLFISRDDIEDRFMKQALAESSALSVLELTYGVRAHTVKDAKRIIGRAHSLNVPLRQIGLAGTAFDTETFTIIANKRPHSIAVWLSFLGMVLCWALMIIFALGATESRLLATLKETDTWIWLGKEQAQLARTTFSGNPAFIRKTDCPLSEMPAAGLPPNGPSSRKKPSATSDPRFNSEDKVILCRIWQDPSLLAALEAAVREQRVAFSLTAALMAAASLFFIYVQRHAAAVRLLERLRGVGSAALTRASRTRSPHLVMHLRVGSWFSCRLRVRWGGKREHS